MANSIQLTIDANDWQRQVNAAVKTLEKLAFYFDNEKRAILEDGAEIVVSEVQARAPIGDTIHVRYPSKPKDSPRAPKGQGRPVARYYPGNLKRSFAILKLRRSDAVIVGAILKRAGQTKGTFAGARADGYYLGFVEYDVEFGNRSKPGKPFVRPAYISAAPRVVTAVTKGCNRFASKFARQYAAATGR